MNKKVNKRKWEGKKMIDEKVKSDFRSIFCKNTMCKILLHSGFLVFLFRFFHMWYKCLHVCVCVCVLYVCVPDMDVMCLPWSLSISFVR